MEFLSRALRPLTGDIWSRRSESPSLISDFTANPSRFIARNPTLDSQKLTLRWSISYPAPPTLATPIQSLVGFFLWGTPPAVEYPVERTFLEGLERTPEIVIQYRETPSSEPESSYDQGSNTITIYLNSHLEGKNISARLISDSREIEEGLKTRIYDVCSGDEVIRKELDLTEGSVRDLYFRESVIPRMVEIRREALKEFIAGELLVVSKKQPYMQFSGHGEMSLRILPDGSTFIVLPIIKPKEGGMKKVKYGILISPNCDKISVEMICKLREGNIQETAEDGRVQTTSRRSKYLPLFQGSFDATLTIPDHPNILFPTAMIPHPGKTPGSTRVDPKRLEMIIPKCDLDLYDFLGEWYNGRRTASQYESLTHIKSAFQYLKEISSAMLHLHLLGYLYCDLKPENVMLKKLPDGSLTAKLIDFDLLVSDRVKVCQGTLSYYPAGALNNSRSTDLYAFGRLISYRQFPRDETMQPSFTSLFNSIKISEKSRGNRHFASIIGETLGKLCHLSDLLLSEGIANYQILFNILQDIEAEFEAARGGAGGSASSHPLGGGASSVPC